MLTSRVYISVLTLLICYAKHPSSTITTNKKIIFPVSACPKNLETQALIPCLILLKKNVTEFSSGFSTGTCITVSPRFPLRKKKHHRYSSHHLHCLFFFAHPSFSTSSSSFFSSLCQRPSTSEQVHEEYNLTLTQ